MKFVFLLSCVFASCSLQLAQEPCVYGESLTKQKQKLALLQKKLHQAEGQHKKAKAEVERLEGAVRETQLALIRRQIDEYRRHMQKNLFAPQKLSSLVQFETSSLFLKERELLHQIIQQGPSSSAFEAQVVLDQILEMITDLSNQPS